MYLSISVYIKMPLDKYLFSINNVYMLNTDHNTASYQAKFADFLLTKKYGSLSVKSYLADLEHYLDWAATKIKRANSKLSNHNSLTTFFSSRALEQYLLEIQGSESPSAIKRRLAALSSFLKYACAEKWLNSSLLNVFKTLAETTHQALKTTDQVLSDFTLHLQEKQTPKNSLRSYVADIKEFLTITN